MNRQPLDAEQLSLLREAANAAADAGGSSALAWFRHSDLAASDKSGSGAVGFDPVTQADRAAEAAIRDTLAALRPDDGVVGEEDAPRPSRSGLTWVIDPIDGTRAFMSGAPSWGVLIALNDGARPVIGVIDQPFTGERFDGLSHRSLREALWRRGDARRALRTRACPRLSDATLYTTFPEVGTPDERAAFDRVRDRVRLTRYGLDCYAYALVAAGCVDLVIEAGLQPYDVQALMPVIEGAGGVVTDWRGGDCAQGGRVVAAGDPALHAAALALLSQARDRPDFDAGDERRGD